ncbi:MAG: hypothetical protein HY557_00630, partial [Euryarchaeota archaeon]|nr:hypothetical protein [Euryarchaeota archaeon]
WVEREFDDVALDLLAGHVRKDRRVSRVHFTFEPQAEDAKNVRLTVKVACKVGDWDLVESFRTRVRIQKGVCPTCSRQRGKYFVGTVQLRADGRDLAEEEVRRAETIASRLEARRGEEEFVSETEAVRGGVDVKVSTNQFAKKLAQEFAKKFGGTLGSSATLHTQREGKDMYRATYVVRIPAFRVGDVIQWRGARHRVIGLGDSVRLEDLATGAKVSVRSRELRGARVVRE